MFRTRNIKAEALFNGDVEVAQMTNAMPTRPARPGMRNLTGLYLGVEGERVTSPSRNVVPAMARGRGMPSHRIRTPTEQRRYRKVELLRTRDERRGFTGNPLKRRPGVPATEYDEPGINSYQQPEPLTFWDLTRQTQRNFTAANNSGVTHLEYLKPDPSGGMTNFHPSAFEDSLAETVTREIHRAAALTSQQHTEEDMSGLVECYKKICRVGAVPLFDDSLPVPPSRRPRSTFSARSIAAPAQADPANTTTTTNDVSPDTRRAKSATCATLTSSALSTITKSVLLQISPSYAPDFDEINNQDTLNTLLPMRKRAQENPNRIPSKFSPTGFCVKSYRKPHQAEILATFPDPSTRPQTVLGVTHRAFVPSPYFFKGYNAPASAVDRYSRSYTPYSEGPHIVGGPGTSGVSRSVSRGKPSSPRTVNTPIDTESLLQTKSETNQTHEKESKQGQESIEKVEISIPAAEDSFKENQKQTESKEEGAPSSATEAEHTAEQSAEQAESHLGDDITEAADMMGHVTHPGSKLEKTPSGSEIIIGLENEIGEKKPVDIDDTEDQVDEEGASNGSMRRKVSITGRILKSKNSEEQVAQLHQEAENRKKQLEDLLDEHAQIVHEVEVAIESESTTGEQEDGLENKENITVQLTAEL